MRFQIFLLLLVYHASQTIAWVMSKRSFILRFTAARCVRQSNLTSFVNCGLSDLKRRQQGLCVRLKLASEIRQLRLDFLLLTTRPNQPDFLLANLTNIDGCSFLEKTAGFNVLDIIRKEFEKYSIFPKKCPVAKDTEIYIKDLIMDENNFPPYVPETNFNVKVNLWEQMTPLFQIFINGSVERKNRGKL